MWIVDLNHRYLSFGFHNLKDYRDGVSAARETEKFNIVDPKMG